MRGRLNLFQAAMLRWRELHPYSAVHVVRIDRPLDAKRLAAVIEGELVALGLTGLALDVARGRFEYKGGPSEAMLMVRAGGAAPMAVIAHAIEGELNAPFRREGLLDPFRFFAVDAGSSFHLGLAYDHVVAGGDSIVTLMRGFVNRYLQGNDAATPPRPLDRYPPTYGKLFLRHVGPVVRGLRRLPGMAASFRRAVRPRYPGGTDPHNGFTYFRLDPPDFATVVRAAKAWSVTVNDLLLSMLLQALAPIVGERPESERRHEIAVASIVNIRRDVGLDDDRTFGQFLSSFSVSHPMPPGASLRDVARDVRQTTGRIKRERLYLQSLLAVAAGGAIWRLLSIEQRQRFYAKNYPVWGAITMLDVDALWQEQGTRVTPPEYMRAVSTGAPTPLVVAVTTAAGILHAGITYRTAAYSRADVDSIAATIIASAKTLDSCA